MTEQIKTEETTETKICSKCKESLPLSAFAVDASKKDGRQSQCRVCKHKTRNPLPLPPLMRYRLVLCQ